MNPNTATNKELRDWLARKQGWSKNIGWFKYTWMQKDGEGSFAIRSDHPIPNTIDAAAKCLPEGWKLYRMAEPASGAFGWSAVRKMVKVGVLATDDEATDRFRLAAKAIVAMEDSK